VNPLINNEIKLLIEEASSGGITLEEPCENIKVRCNFKCLTCNESWSTSARSIIQNKLTKCPYCNKSRYRYKDVYNLLKKDNITFLEKECKNITLKNKLKCDKCDHIWYESLSGLRKKEVKCPNCTRLKRYDFEYIKTFLEDNGMEFVDDKYINSKYLHKIKCKKCNNIRKAAIGRLIRTGSGCKKCFHESQRKTFDEVEKICKDKNLKLLDEYKGVVDFHRYECLKCGFVNNTNLHRIKISKHGCVKCSGKLKYKLKEVKEICLKRNIIFLDSEYTNNTYPNNFKCNICNYEWEGTFKYVSRNGCPGCNSNRLRTIQEIKRDCKKFDVICLTRKKKKVREKYKFRCRRCNEKWEDTLSGFANHNKCRNKKCRNVLFGEEEVRSIFEKIFNKKFIKVNPDWLRNPRTGYRLQLDGYCEELNLAFEYNGRQHYEIVKEFKMTEKRLEMQKFTDKFKINKCKERGIVLIIIPQIDLYIKYSDLKTYIYKHLRLNNIL